MRRPANCVRTLLSLAALSSFCICLGMGANASHLGRYRLRRGKCSETLRVHQDNASDTLLRYTIDVSKCRLLEVPFSSMPLSEVENTTTPGEAYVWKGTATCDSDAEFNATISVIRLFCHRLSTVVPVDGISREEGVCYADLRYQERNGDGTSQLCIYEHFDHGSVLEWVVAGVVLFAALLFAIVCIMFSRRRRKADEAQMNFNHRLSKVSSRF